MPLELTELSTKVDCGPIILQFVDQVSGSALPNSYFETGTPESVGNQNAEFTFKILKQEIEKSLGTYKI